MFFEKVITIFNVFVLLVTLVLTLLYLYFKWSYSYWSKRGVTAPPYSFPFGNIKEVALGRVSLQEMFKELYANLKPKGIKYSGFYFIHKPQLVIFDLELIKSILVKDFSHFTDHGFFDTNNYDSFSGHLFGLKGAEWKNMREKLTPLFTIGKLKMMFTTIESCSDELVTLINQAAEVSEGVNISDIACRYAIDIVASVGFGIESNSLKNPTSDFRKYAERAAGNADMAGALRMFCHVLIPDILSILKIPEYPKDATTFFLETVKSTIKYREENQILRKDFMQLMIQLRNNIDISDKINDCFNLKENTNGNPPNNKDKCSLSIEDVTAQTMLFIVAGFESTSVTFSLCMYELANQQDIQEKLRDEIKTVLNKHEGELSYNAIMEMTYMEKCIKEALRKYPILSSLFRRCTKTYQVPGSDLIIEEGMIVMIPAQELHYDPEYYPNPEKFDPERFSSENISSKNNFTWLPYGEGPRVCIGVRLSMITIKVALTKLLKDFRFTLDSRTCYPIKRAPMRLFLKADGGVWLKSERIIK